MSTKTIAQEWGGFCKMVFGDNKPGEIQYTAMRQAFYGGAMIMFKNMIETGRLDNDEAMKIMDDFSKEIMNYATESAQSLTPDQALVLLTKLAEAILKEKP
jgi:hypothetical protein